MLAVSKVALMASQTLAMLEDKGYIVGLGMVAGNIYEVKLFSSQGVVDIILSAKEGLRANNKEALERARHADPLIENI